VSCRAPGASAGCGVFRLPSSFVGSSKGTDDRLLLPYLERRPEHRVPVFRFGALVANSAGGVVDVESVRDVVPTNASARSSTRARYPVAAVHARALILSCQHAHPPLSVNDWKVVAAVLHQVNFWSRVDDAIAISVLCSITALSDRTVRRILAKLAKRGLGLDYTPRRGRGYASHISTVGAPDAASHLAAPPTWVPQKTGAAERDQATLSEKKPASEDRKAAPQAAAKPASPLAEVSASEKVREDSEKQGDCCDPTRNPTAAEGIGKVRQALAAAEARHRRPAPPPRGSRTTAADGQRSARQSGP
jgi:hypothetical protein